jgi:FKBP-type peptidyl-prolyl cis-trans isomerase
MIALAASLAACADGTGTDTGAGTSAAMSGSSDAAAAVADPALDTDEQRTLYALGVALGRNVGEFELTESELEIVSMGLRDGALDAPYQVDMAVYGQQIQQLANDRASAAASVEREASQAFAAEIAAEPGAEVFDSGLVLVPMVEGDGDSPTAEDTVRVHYHGTLRDGTVFDSSVDRGESISFPLSGVIPCWTEGVQKMRVGGKAKLGCPSDIAYGDGGAGSIPGGATLLFEVELLGIE